MPAPAQDILIKTQNAPIRVELEPVHNLFHSLMLILKSQDLSGFGPWVTETAAQLSEAEMATHRLVMIGLFFAIYPDGLWPNFPTYLDYLADVDPVVLRDKMLDHYLHMPLCDDVDQAQTADYTVQQVLAGPDAYVAFLKERFGVEHIEEDLERQAYTYAINPTALQILVVSHLRTMWETYLRSEWQRIRPLLQASAAAFHEVDFSQMSRREAAEFITGQSLSSEPWLHQLEEAERVIFVPSTHVGPYLGRFKADGAFGIIFGARLPEGTSVHAPELNRAEIVVRLSALADDTRLRILKFIAEQGEQRSQDVMQHLELSQSAASRHLTQLSATGYLNERRCEGAKCYTLNADRIRNTLHAVTIFLTGA